MYYRIDNKADFDFDLILKFDNIVSFTGTNIFLKNGDLCYYQERDSLYRTLFVLHLTIFFILGLCIV